MFYEIVLTSKIMNRKEDLIYDKLSSGEDIETIHA
jgi:hypothetical protein